MKRILIVLALMCLPTLALACGGADCTASGSGLSCAGGSPNDGAWCVMVCENGVCTCDDIGCSGGGGGGWNDIPVTYSLPLTEEQAVLQNRLAKFSSMSQSEARVACAMTPGCMMFADGAVFRSASTWGAIKSRYR